MIMTEVLQVPQGMYRQCGDPRQLKEYRCFSETDILKFIEQNNKDRPCFISVCAYVNQKSKVLLYVPFDFDSKDRKDAFRDALTLSDFCKNMGWRVILTDTTNKGYHVWIPCQPKSYSNETLRKFQQHLIDRLELKTADIQVLGQSNRLMRIPMTFHEKTKKLCGCLVYKIDGYLVDLDDWFPTQEDNKNRECVPKNGGEVSSQFYPCLSLRIQDENPEHWIRYAHALSLIKEGKNDEEIINIYMTYNWRDWSVNYTQNQLNHIRRNNGRYNMLTCKTLQERKVCLKEECLRYKRSLNGSR